MKIVLIGTVEFSRSALSKLLELEADVVGVVTKKVSAFNADYAELAPICEQVGIPYRFTEDVNGAENLNWIRSLRPDVVFCFGWSQILRKELLRVSPMGVIGFHPAELPMNRGRHPLIWALALGLSRTASTFFFMDGGADSGDILSQKIVEIAYEDDARTLYDKITRIALGQMEGFLPRLVSGNNERVSQDHSKTNYWRKRGKEDGKIDFRMSSRSIYNLVRALTRPYAGAHLEYGGGCVKVWKVKEGPVDWVNVEPGKVLEVAKAGVLIKCGDGALLLTDHEFSKLPQAGEYL